MKFAAQGENRLLGALPDAAGEALRADSEKISLSLKDTLFKGDQDITYVYFPLSGVISLVLRMADGLTVEVATVGNEGFVGVPVYLGTRSSPTEAFCQVPGEALKVPADAFCAAVRSHAQADELLRRYTHALITQVSQTAACNHLHSVQQRMCRWLLMTHDRVGSDVVPLTQEFLSQMLGVRRPSVTVVAGILQQAGLIEYSRGRIRICDRVALERGACECYEVVRREYERLFSAAVAA